MVARACTIYSYCTNESGPQRKRNPHCRGVGVLVLVLRAAHSLKSAGGRHTPPHQDLSRTGCYHGLAGWGFAQKAEGGACGLEQGFISLHFFRGSIPVSAAFIPTIQAISREDTAPSSTE